MVASVSCACRDDVWEMWALCFSSSSSISSCSSSRRPSISSFSRIKSATRFSSCKNKNVQFQVATLVHNPIHTALYMYMDILNQLESHPVPVHAKTKPNCLASEAMFLFLDLTTVCTSILVLDSSSFCMIISSISACSLFWALLAVASLA